MAWLPINRQILKCGSQMIIGIIVKYPVKQFTDGEIFREGTFKEDVVLDLNKELAVMCGLLLKEPESVLQPM